MAVKLMMKGIMMIMVMIMGYRLDSENGHCNAPLMVKVALMMGEEGSNGGK